MNPTIAGQLVAFEKHVILKNFSAATRKPCQASGSTSDYQSIYAASPATVLAEI